MSLINEALKKAQSERPASVHKHPALQGMPVEPHQKPPRKKRYLFSFVLAVLIVALLSTLVSTYLVYQILGNDKPEEDNSPVSGEVVTTTKDTPPGEPVEAVETQPVQPVEPGPAVMEEPAAAIAREQPAATTEPVAQSVPEAVSPGAEIAASAPSAQPVSREPVKEVATVENNPLIWSRLEDLEIRGIMSGGTKVLIFDSRTSKARAYKPGDLVDGALSLKLSSISPNLINFENNDGLIFPKAF